MKDFFGQGIAIGDEVAYSSLDTAHLHMGKVVNFSDKQVTIEIDRFSRPNGKMVTRKISKKPELLIIKPWVSIL